MQIAVLLGACAVHLHQTRLSPSVPRRNGCTAVRSAMTSLPAVHSALGPLVGSWTLEEQIAVPSVWILFAAAVQTRCSPARARVICGHLLCYSFVNTTRFPTTAHLLRTPPALVTSCVCRRVPVGISPFPLNLGFVVRKPLLPIAERALIFFAHSLHKCQVIVVL